MQLAESRLGAANMVPVDNVASPPVGLLNAYSTRNLGDAAIMSALIEMLPGRQARAVIHDAEPVAVRGLTLSGRLTACNRFVSVGGDIFNNARPAFITRAFLDNVLTLHAHADRAILFGQSIPASCGWLGLSMLAAVLRRTQSVVMRDEHSLELLRRKGVRAELSYDAAFVLRPCDAGIWGAQRAFALQGLAPERTVLLSIRSFDSLYPHNEAEFITKMTRLATALIDRGHQVAAIVQSDVDQRDSDRRVISQLQAMEPRLCCLDCFSGSDLCNPVDFLIGALAIAKVVVAVRYHTAVLRLVCGRQPYNLFYSGKGRDLGARLGLTGCPVNAFDPEAMISDVEATAEQIFDPDPLSVHVRQTFQTALRKLS